MKFVYNVCLIVLLLSTFKIKAQDPLIKGTIYLSAKQATMECNLVFTNIPRANDYLILLNSDLKIRYFKNPGTNYSYGFHIDEDDSLNAIRSNGYYFSDYTGEVKYLPQNLVINYYGKIPGVNDSLLSINSAKWKNQFCYFTQPLNTGSGEFWYPIIYDIDKNIKYEHVKYDIDVYCADCEYISMNEHKFSDSAVVHFSSKKSKTLNLLCK